MRNMSTDKNSIRNKKIVYLYLKGIAVKKIAENFNLSPTTIYRVLKKYDVDTTRSQREVKSIYRKKILTGVLQDKKSVQDLSAELKLPQEVVNGILTHEFNQLKIKKEQEKKRQEEKKRSQEGKLPTSSSKISMEFTAPAGKVDGTQGTATGPDAVKPLSKVEAKGYFIDKNSLFQGVPKNPTGEDFDLVMRLVGQETVSLTKTDRTLMDLLRACLKYSAEQYNMTDYSTDPYLLPDYLLPLDILIQKDMMERHVQGETASQIARHHRVDVSLVRDTVNGRIHRDTFRTRFFMALSSLLLESPDETKQ